MHGNIPSFGDKDVDIFGGYCSACPIRWRLGAGKMALPSPAAAAAQSEGFKARILPIPLEPASCLYTCDYTCS